MGHGVLAARASPALPIIVCPPSHPPFMPWVQSRAWSGDDTPAAAPATCGEERYISTGRHTWHFLGIFWAFFGYLCAMMRAARHPQETTAGTHEHATFHGRAWRWRGATGGRRGAMRYSFGDYVLD